MNWPLTSPIQGTVGDVGVSGNPQSAVRPTFSPLPPLRPPPPPLSAPVSCHKFKVRNAGPRTEDRKSNDGGASEGAGGRTVPWRQLGRSGPRGHFHTRPGARARNVQRARINAAKSFIKPEFWVFINFFPTNWQST